MRRKSIRIKQVFLERYLSWEEGFYLHCEKCNMIFHVEKTDEGLFEFCCSCTKRILIDELIQFAYSQCLVGYYKEEYKQDFKRLGEAIGKLS